jgi:hypothetical protein
MADQVLKDGKGFTIGKITTGSNGVLTIKDAKGFTKGSYDPKTTRQRTPKGL